MPLAAVNTRLVDVVPPAGQLAEKLMDFIQHRPQLPHDPGQLTDEEAQTLQHILAHIYQSGEEALKKLPRLKVDLALIDVSLPTMSGIDVVRQIHAEFPHLRCLILSGHLIPK